MARRNSVPNSHGMSQLSFVQTDSDDDKERRPILPSSSKKRSNKNQRLKMGRSITPGVAIQTISFIDKEPESTGKTRAFIPKNCDRKSFSSHKKSTVKKIAKKPPEPATKQRPFTAVINPQKPRYTAGKRSDNNVPPSKENHHLSQDMEVPYAINLGIEGDENLIMACALSDCPKEPLNPGDVIHYFHPAFAAGSDLSIRVTQVIATDPFKSDFPLELDNGELIPRDTRMRRLKEYDNGKLYNHPGIFRDLGNFLMKKRSLSSAERKMLSNSRQKTVDLLNDILNKANEKLENLPAEMLALPAPSSQKKRKAPFEPIHQTESDDSDTSSSTSSDLSDRSVAVKESIHQPENDDSDSSSSTSSDLSEDSVAVKERQQKMITISKFSIDGQQARKDLSLQPISDNLTSPKQLVLKNIGGLKDAPKTVKEGKTKKRDGELLTSREPYRNVADTSVDSTKRFKQNDVTDATTKTSNANNKATSSTEERLLETPPKKRRKISTSHNYDLDSSDSDDEILNCPVFGGGRDKDNTSITDKSKIAPDPTNSSCSAKLMAAFSAPANETSRWSLGSNNNIDDGLWDSCESDNELTHISATKKRRLAKANHGQSSSSSRDQSVTISRKETIKNSSFLPFELETQDSSCTSHNQDDTLEKEIWEEYQPSILHRRTSTSTQEKHEDIEGFSSQETPEKRSRVWRSRFAGQQKLASSASTLKLKPLSRKGRL